MTAANDVYFEGFDEWVRNRMKTHRDMNYWSDDEMRVAEIAWCEAWDNAEKASAEEIKSLKARIRKLEEECAWLDSVGTAGQSSSRPSMSCGYLLGPSSALGSAGDLSDD